MTQPSNITVRSYQVGFGDCFLVSFEYEDGEKHVLIDFGSTSLPKDAPKSRMLDVANDIKDRVGENLVAVVATHRHKDHISGFATAKNGKASGNVIALLKPKLVLQPWTEDPKLALDATGPRKAIHGTTKNARHKTASLTEMQQVAGIFVNEVKRNRSGLPAIKKLKDDIRFIGEDNISNVSAVKNLMTMARNEYLHTGQKTKLQALLPGVKIHVLGPPTVDQTDTVLKMRAKDKDQFWHLMAAAGGLMKTTDTGNAVAPLFPYHLRARTPAGFPIDARWLIHHARKMRFDQMLRIVTLLDDALNNTSLILLFEVGKKKLLFPGDAQWENWAYALNQPKYQKLLKDVDLYKVGHHGSLNATPKDLWNLFNRKSKDAKKANRLTSLMSTMEGKHGSVTKGTEVPRTTLTAALKRESNLFTTQDLTGADFHHDTIL